MAWDADMFRRNKAYIILFLTVRANGPVFIYTFTYGNSLFLCLLGGMAVTGRV